MSTRMRPRPGQNAGTSDGSRTITIHDVPTDEQSDNRVGEGGSSDENTTGVLRLRGGGNTGRRVVWQEGTVDNEGMGKKKSKICCIYHKPKAFDESSSESGSSSGSDSDTGSDSDQSSVSDHSQSSGASVEGVNATKSLEEKKKRLAKQKGNNGKSPTCGDHGCARSHTHDHKSRKNKRKGKTNKGVGSHTMTVTREEERKEENSEIEGEPPRKTPNAYEKGIT